MLYGDILIICNWDKIKIYLWSVILNCIGKWCEMCINVMI